MKRDEGAMQGDHLGSGRPARDHAWIGPDELNAAVDMQAAIHAVDDAMRRVSNGQVVAPLRWTMPINGAGKMGLMPGAAPSDSRFGIKVLSLFDGAARGTLPSHQGVMLLFDASGGRLLCALDAAALTVLRTAAATAVATRALMRPESTTLAIIGCGELAALHVAAIRAIMPLQRIFLWNRTPSKARRLAATLESDINTTICNTPNEAASAGDVVCLLTSSNEPLVRGHDLRAGQHVNLVGSSTAGPREIDDVAVVRSSFIVDSREHALAQAAELKSAIANGLVTAAHIAGEIGDVLLGRVCGRKGANDITIYKSLGHVAQDLAVANVAYENIRRQFPGSYRACSLLNEQTG